MSLLSSPLYSVLELRPITPVRHQEDNLMISLTFSWCSKSVTKFKIKITSKELKNGVFIKPLKSGRNSRLDSGTFHSSVRGTKDRSHLPSVSVANVL